MRLRYAISYVGPEQARRNLEAEVRDFDLERLAAEARAEWNAALGKVVVEGGTDDEKAVFYTALYRAHERMARISEDGRYFSAWDGRVHDDGGVPFWTDDWVWDTFHALHPLQVLLNPGAQGEKLASYVRACEQSGWMPTFPTVFGDAHCMNGQHAAARRTRCSSSPARSTTATSGRRTPASSTRRTATGTGSCPSTTSTPADRAPATTTTRTTRGPISGRSTTTCPG